MKKICSFAVAAVAMMAAASCAHEEFDGYQAEGAKVTFTATIGADEADTKAELDTSENGKPQTMWTAGDMITVHNGDNGFEFATDDAGKSAEFTYDGNDFTAENGVIAVYPAGDYDADLEGLSVVVNVPSVQTATAGSYDPAAAVAVAYSTDDHLRFKNATAMLKFTVGTENIKSVVFEGLDGEAVSGDAAVVMTETGAVASVTAGTGAAASVELVAEEYFEVGTTYYMNILPQTFSAGFTIGFRFVEDGPVHTALDYKQNRNIGRNILLNVGELAVDLYEGLTDATPVLNSMKFTVENNPGKILGREFTHTLKSSLFSSSYNVSVTTVKEKSCTIADGKVSLYVPYLNDRRLVPTFSIPAGTALMFEGGIIESGVTVVDFCKYKEIRVVNGNGDEAVYAVDFTNTGLPVVVVNQYTGIGNTEDNSDYEKASTAWSNATGTGWIPKDGSWHMADDGSDNFMVYNPDGTSALVDKKEKPLDGPVMSSTRLRGNVTQQMPKKPFAVKLDSKTGIHITNIDGSRSEMKPHKRWVLLANWKDRTLLRNEVAFGLAEVFRNNLEGGMAWNPSGQHVELVYNGVHVGNYYLCEQIKVDGNRVDINEPLDDEDNPYTGDPSVFGYLLEADDGYDDDEPWKFTTANYIPFILKDDANDDMLNYAAGFVRGIEDNLYSGNYDAAFEKMDLASFVDFWLIQELMMNSETKHPKSCYHYINDGIMYAGPVWDFDWNTLPTSSSYSEEGYSYTASMLSKAKASHMKSGYPDSPIMDDDANYLWYPMLLKNAEFKALAAERWDAVNEAVSAYIETLGTLQTSLATSEALNNAMWPIDEKGTLISPRYSIFGIGGGHCGDEGLSFAEAVAKLQSTLRSRVSGMNDYVLNKNWPSVSYTEK